MNRPEKITKLAFYLMDKEPLFYLFIINSDFIYEEAKNKDDIAAVGYHNSRVKFFYTKNFIDLPIRQMYFVLIHEAFHIFKKHLMVHENIRKINPELLNIAEDAIINTEILNSTFEGITPDAKGLFPYFIPNDFKMEYLSLGKDAYVSPRLFAWYMKNKKSKSNRFPAYSFVKDVTDGQYGVVLSANGNTYTVVKKDSIDDLLKKSDDLPVEVNQENLIPVFIGSSEYSFQSVSHEGEYEQYGFRDNHDKLLNGDPDDEIISQRVFSEKMIQQAREMVENNSSLKDRAGQGRGNSILDKLETLMVPDVDWRKVLRRNINLYYSNNSMSKSRKKSMLTYLMNAKSRYGMIFKHWIKTKSKLQKYIFIAMDTSGSCFSDAYDIERFFSEIDTIATELSFSNSGRVFLMQWDYGVASPWKEYKKGDWKDFVVRGGGGTNPRVVFDYISKEFKPIGEFSLVSQLNKDDKESTLFIPDKNKMPFMIVLTDGIFWGRMKTSDLGYYESNHKNVLFITKQDGLLYKGANSILFK